LDELISDMSLSGEEPLVEAPLVVVLTETVGDSRPFEVIRSGDTVDILAGKANWA
jgi:hypothetical protein